MECGWAYSDFQIKLARRWITNYFTVFTYCHLSVKFDSLPLGRHNIVWRGGTGSHGAQQSLPLLEALQQSQIIHHGPGAASSATGRGLLLQEMSCHLLAAKVPS